MRRIWNYQIISECNCEIFLTANSRLTTDEIRAVRKKLKLTQEKASLLFGGGVRAFHKYETGENAQSRPLDILLKLMDSGKISMDDLQRIG